MNSSSPLRAPIQRIVVRITVGSDRMAASDDPLFLELHGPLGRDFRLAPKQGRALRRGAEDRFVLGAGDDPDVNIAFPELNDPTSPRIEAAALTGVALRKGLEPIPNVRGFGEMDDRLQLMDAEVEIHVEGEPKPRRYARKGPFWLGLVCGLRSWLAPAD